MRTFTLPGVHRPLSDCWLLADVMRKEGLAADVSVLDVFTGSGALAVTAALNGARQVTAIDLSRRALIATRLNALLNRVPIRTLRGTLFAPVAHDSFGLILANPPYIPSTDGSLPSRGASRAWEGGFNGRFLLDRLCRSAVDHLVVDGTLLLVQSSVCGEQATLDLLRESGLEPAVLARRRGPLGPLLSARAEMFERRGLLRKGEREEELQVVAAKKPAFDSSLQSWGKNRLSQAVLAD